MQRRDDDGREGSPSDSQVNRPSSPLNILPEQVIMLRRLRQRADQAEGLAQNTTDAQEETLAQNTADEQGQEASPARSPQPADQAGNGLRQFQNWILAQRNVNVGGAGEDNNDEPPEQDANDNDDEPASPEPQPRVPSGRPTRPWDKTLYNIALRSSPKPNAALPDAPIGLVELYTFFPQHTQWPAGMMRAIGNGWTVANIRDMVLVGRGLDSMFELKKRDDALRRQVGNAAKQFFGIPDWTRERYPSTIHPRDLLNGHLWDPVRRRNARADRVLPDLRLIDLANGVVNWPTGNNRGVITQAIHLAVQTQNNIWRVSDIPQIIQTHNLQMPHNWNAIQWDEDALQDFLNNLGDDFFVDDLD